MSEAGKMANLTKKAIEYYTEQGLVSPDVLDNGYRDFSEDDVERLRKISIFRRLGLGTDEIKGVLSDETHSTLQKISVQRELTIQREQTKKAMLNRLSCGESYAQINAALTAMEQKATITEKLLGAFPGYYGRFICLHFARFLNEPMTTDDQQSAYAQIIAFLDNAPTLAFPEDVQSFLIENTGDISTENICSMIESTKQSIENPDAFDAFLAENKETLVQYLAYKQSQEYKASPVCKLQALLTAFCSTSGYYDILIPAMKRLSASYAAYFRQMEIANERLLTQYPEIAALYAQCE